MAEVCSEMGVPTTSLPQLSTTSPSSVRISWTMWGLSSSPPLTAALHAVKSCTGETETLWPKATRAMSTSFTYL